MKARRDVTRQAAAAVIGAAVLLLGMRRPAAAASVEDCREFHQQCTEARAAGYHDVGICNVERLECSADRDAGVPKGAHEARRGRGTDAERSVGERSVGP